MSFFSADTILLINTSLKDHLPLLNHRVRQAALNGAKVIRITSYGDEVNYPVAKEWVCHPNQISNSINKVLEACAQEGLADDALVNDIASLLRNSKQCKVIVGSEVLLLKSAPHILKSTHQLCDKISAKWGQLTLGSNSQGAWMVGAVPYHQDQIGLNAKEMFEQKLKAYVIHQFEPEFDTYDPTLAISALKEAECVIAMTSYDTESLRDVADVLLPIANHTEFSGTYVNVCGALQNLMQPFLLQKILNHHGKCLGF